MLSRFRCAFYDRDSQKKCAGKRLEEKELTSEGGALSRATCGPERDDGRVVNPAPRADWGRCVHYGQNIHYVYNGQMRSFSATDAKQRLAALLDAAQREPVVIRRQNRDVAVIMSAEEYERLRDLNTAEFQRFCDHVSASAKSRGLTATKLEKLLNP